MTTLIKDSVPYVCFLLGATCCGKGYGTSLAVEPLAERGLRINVIDMGKLIRHRLDTDPEFNAKWDHVVAAGDLLPDEEAIPMFEMDYHQKKDCDLLCIDGYERSVPQVEHAASLGLLSDRATTVVMKTAVRYCYERNKHRIERMLEKGKPRPDAAAFPKRYKIFENTIGDIHASIVDLSSQHHRVHVINGNRDLKGPLDDKDASVSGHLVHILNALMVPSSGLAFMPHTRVVASVAPSVQLTA